MVRVRERVDSSSSGTIWSSIDTPLERTEAVGSTRLPRAQQLLVVSDGFEEDTSTQLDVGTSAPYRSSAEPGTRDLDRIDLRFVLLRQANHVARVL